MVQSAKIISGETVSETINLRDAKTNLSKLVDRAAGGEEIIIAKAGKPMAKLVPYDPPRKRRIGGQNLLGMTYMADDWKGPLPPDIQRYFDGESDEPRDPTSDPNTAR